MQNDPRVPELLADILIELNGVNARLERVEGGVDRLTVGLTEVKDELIALRNDVTRLEHITEEQSFTLRAISDKLNRQDALEQRVTHLEEVVFKK